MRALAEKNTAVPILALVAFDTYRLAPAAAHVFPVRYIGWRGGRLKPRAVGRHAHLVDRFACPIHQRFGRRIIEEVHGRYSLLHKEVQCWLSIPLQLP